jgi:hypothetical protein
MEGRTHANSPLPTISRVCSDGTLIELLYRPDTNETALAMRLSDGRVSVEQTIDLPTGERLVPYSAANNLIASGCVRLPSDVGEFGDVGDLVEEIHAFLRRYVALSPVFEEIAAYYVLLSWVYDAFNELPYLRFRGDYGTGKTRALLAVGSLCYKPFFASGASTVSPIFHILDAFGGTLILDEADFRFSDATAELTKILNNGNAKGMPVLRTITNRHKELNPQAFKVYGPKLIAMRESFADKALESRFLTENTGRPMPVGVPIHTPDSLAIEATELRNKLLAWRFAARFTVGPDAGRLVHGVEPRINQTALALLSLIDDVEVRQRIEAELIGVDATLKEDRVSSQETAMLSTLVEAFAAATGPSVSIAEIARRYNARAGLEISLSNKWVGWFVRTRLRIATTKSNGVYVIVQSQRERIEALARRFGIGPVAATMDSPVPQGPALSRHIGASASAADETTMTSAAIGP